MKARILCVGGSAARWQDWGRDLEADGYVVVHASDETEAAELVRASPVDVVCIDSRAMGDGGSSVLGTRLRTAQPRVPVVLIQSGSKVPPRFEEQVDVVFDESTFSAMGHWLLEELREVRFPLFVEWFEEWKQRRPSGDGKDTSHVYEKLQRTRFA